MSFNSLPNETLQRIVDLCHEADETYRKRMKDSLGSKSKSTDEDFLMDPCKAWRGRSCSAISMINKRLRSMAIKYIFTTLRTSRSQEGIFDCSILGSATGDCIQNLVFDKPNADYLSAFVYNTLPLLPSLRSISGLSQAVSESMMLAKSIGLEDSSDIVEYISRKRAREAILRIAPQVTEWDMELDAEDAELLLGKNYPGIESLSLASSECIGWDILESEESGFPRLLCKFPNLHTLAIHQTREADGSNLEIVHDSILTLSFPFATSLRTLSLDLERDDERTTPNEFVFATMFPNLKSLKMRFRSGDLAEINQGSSYLLPKLTSLEIVNCPFLHLHKLLHVFSLPSISSIHLKDANIPFILPTSDEKIEEIRQVVLELGCYPSTLRSLRLQFPWNPWKLPSLALDHLVALTSTIDVLIVPEPEQSRSGRGRRPPNFDEDSDEVSDEDSNGTGDAGIGRQRLLGGRREDDNGFQATKELVDWAQKRVYSCGTVDDVGLQEMRRFLEPMRDLKEWIED